MIHRYYRKIVFKKSRNLISDETFQTQVTCYVYHPVIPTDMNLTVTAAYITAKGIPVVITHVTSLPLRLVVKPCAPIKEADYKVTISTNKPAVSLLDLFPGKNKFWARLQSCPNRLAYLIFGLTFRIRARQHHVQRSWLSIFWWSLCDCFVVENIAKVPITI